MTYNYYIGELLQSELSQSDANKKIYAKQFIWGFKTKN